MNLELQLECKLQLTRRARVCRGESRAGNGREACRHAKSTARKRCQRDDGGSVGSQWPWLAKVRMVEHVKRIRAELKVDSLGDLRVLDQGKIDVSKPGAIDYVATEVAKAAGGR